jgi:hypothetical protein
VWCPRGPMDKASAYEAGDCGFESRRRLLLFLSLFLVRSGRVGSVLVCLLACTRALVFRLSSFVSSFTRGFSMPCASSVVLDPSDHVHACLLLAIPGAQDHSATPPSSWRVASRSVDGLPLWPLPAARSLASSLARRRCALLRPPCRLPGAMRRLTLLGIASVD